MCDPTNHKSYGSGVTAVTEVRKCIVSILDDIIVFFYRFFYDTAARGSLMQSPNAKAVSGNVFPLLLLHITHKSIRTL